MRQNSPYETLNPLCTREQSFVGRNIKFCYTDYIFREKNKNKITYKIYLGKQYTTFDPPANKKLFYLGFTFYIISEILYHTNWPSVLVLELNHSCNVNVSLDNRLAKS